MGFPGKNIGMRVSRPTCIETTRLAPTRFKPSGFTLIELMVALAVAAIVIGMAVPSFQSVVNTNKLAGAVNEMVASLQLARMEAIRHNRRAAVCSSANANDGVDATCASADVDGWITFVDANGDGDFDKAGDTLLRVSQLQTPVVLTASGAIGNSVVFRSDGLARASATDLLDGIISFCIATTRPADNARHLEIGSGSRISVSDHDGGGACDPPADP